MGANTVKPAHKRGGASLEGRLSGILKTNFAGS